MATQESDSVPGACDSVQAAKLIDDFDKELGSLDGLLAYGSGIGSLQSVKRILELPPEQQVAVVIEAIARQTERMRRFGSRASFVINQSSWERVRAFKELISLLLRKKLACRVDDVDRLIQVVSTGKGYYSWQLPLGGILRVLEGFCREGGLPDRLRPRLAAFRDTLLASAPYAETRNAIKRLDQLLAAAPAAAPDSLLTTDEAWTRYLRAQLHDLDTDNKTAWKALLFHCGSARQSKPSQKWLQRAGALVADVGPAAFSAVLSGTLAEIGKPGTPQITQIFDQRVVLDPTLIHGAHSDLLRGLVWCTCLVKDDGLTVAVGDAAVLCFKKIANVGPRAPKIGNACLYALSANPSLTAVGQLTRLKTRAKHASIQKQLAKALDSAADKTGMNAVEMEEVAVPSCGLTEVGSHRLRLGDITAVLDVRDGSKAEVTWQDCDGKKLKSVPVSVKETFAADIQSLKQSEKEIAKLLPAQRERLEQLFLQQRSWSFPEFRSRYLDHPVVGILARRLVWRFSDSAHVCDGTWLDGQIVDDRDQVLDWLSTETRVVLWHPLACGLEHVRAWRDWLDRHQVRQPFKQAHREIYILTDAERRTETYSNRFAAHIIRQHQFCALCQQRGWRYTLQGNWDSHNIPTLHLPQCELRAEFWVEPLTEHAEDAEPTASGVYRYLSTDQVRFYRSGQGDPMSLANVPPLVLSEVLRDVDLFVGVTSAGNDPSWSDGGPEGRFRDYWQSYSFGNLSATAETRRVVLEGIVPRLKIAERCSFSEKFLIVRGDLRTYKIHLGSANILMSPNDQYLCIVPKPIVGNARDKVFLPFEGDNQLSTILSQPILLAEDSNIPDPPIVRQIRAGTSTVG